MNTNCLNAIQTVKEFVREGSNPYVAVLLDPKYDSASKKERKKINSLILKALYPVKVDDFSVQKVKELLESEFSFKSNCLSNQNTVKSFRRSINDWEKICAFYHTLAQSHSEEHGNAYVHPEIEKWFLERGHRCASSDIHREFKIYLKSIDKKKEKENAANSFYGLCVEIVKEKTSKLEFLQLLCARYGLEPGNSIKSCSKKLKSIYVNIYHFIQDDSYVFPDRKSFVAYTRKHPFPRDAAKQMNLRIFLRDI